MSVGNAPSLVAPARSVDLAGRNTELLRGLRDGALDPYSVVVVQLLHSHGHLIVSPAGLELWWSVIWAFQFPLQQLYEQQAQLLCDWEAALDIVDEKLRIAGACVSCGKGSSRRFHRHFLE